MSETVPGDSIQSISSSSGSVVLDLGPDIGALVLHTPPELDGREIQISLLAGAPHRRTHSRVRRRYTPGGVRYAAVYPGLAAGDYVVWGDATTSAMIVTVAGGQVTTASWPRHQAADQPEHPPRHRSRPQSG
jgi:hypothetical protein